MRELWRYRGAAATVALVAALIAVGMPAAADAQRGGGEQLARVTVHANGVDFVPNVEFQKAILTVSGNGNTYREEIPAGRYPSIGIFDPDGQLLADGRYTWRLDLVPTAEIAAGLRAEAEDNGGEPLTRWTPQSGSFAIANGTFADPALSEATARRATRSAGVSETPFTAVSGFDRGPASDDDAAVGSREGYEAQVRAAASRPARQAATGALVGPDRVTNDSDAVAAADGGALERPAKSIDNEFQAQSRSSIARPRSDGSNGRPRSQ